MTAVTAATGGYRVVTERGHWHCATVVIASGACNLATVPPVAAEVPPWVAVHTPLTYRRPADLEHGGVLVVGASATGAQLAEEIHRSSRPVTLSVGEHVRLPRTYRGRDIFWWTDRAGILDERHDEVDDIVRTRNLPSPQLIGTPSRRSIDLDSLASRGIVIVGRLVGMIGDCAQFSGSLANICALADLKANRLLGRLDEWAAESGLDGDLGPPERLRPTAVAATKPVLGTDLRRAGIRSIVFATGYRPDLSWLRLPVFDRRGWLRHEGGVVSDAPGVFVVGHPVLRRRRSSYIDGTVQDSADLGRLLHAHLDSRLRVGSR